MRKFKVMTGVALSDSDVIGRYFHDVARYHPLRADEEAALSRRIRQGDPAALEKLISANLRFVITVARQYQGRGLHLPDLIAEGNLGLIEAARNFDDTRGFKFISYAVWWVRQRILKALEDQVRLIRIPKRQLHQLSQLHAQTARLEQQLYRTPTAGELAEVSDWTEARVHETLQAAPLTHSYDADGFALLDTYCSAHAPADGLCSDQDYPTLLRQALGQLSERERTVIVLSFGLGEDRCYQDQEIGERLGISKQLIHIARNKALTKLRQHQAVLLLA